MVDPNVYEHLHEMLEGGMTLDQLLEAMREYAENQAEGLDYDRRAGDEGITYAHIDSWRKFGDKMDRAADHARRLEG